MENLEEGREGRTSRPRKPLGRRAWDEEPERRCLGRNRTAESQRAGQSEAGPPGVQATSASPPERPTTPDGWQTNGTAGRGEANGREAGGPEQVDHGRRRHAASSGKCVICGVCVESAEEGDHADLSAGTSQKPALIGAAV
jgi:hypothetical protein